MLSCRLSRRIPAAMPGETIAAVLNGVRVKSFLLKTNVYVAFFMVFPAVAGAETVLANINGYTTTAWGLQQFTTMVISDDGRILAVGGEDLLDGQVPASVIDVGGRTVLPGLIDAHAHVYGLGFAKSTLDLVGVQSRRRGNETHR